MRTKKPITVYMLTRGEYSSYEVMGIYSSKAKAQAMQRSYQEQMPMYSASIEPILLDKGYDLVKQGLSLWSVFIQTGRVPDHAQAIDIRTRLGLFPWYNKSAYLAVAAQNEQHALKIATEKWREIEAGELWDTLAAQDDPK